MKVIFTCGGTGGHIYPAIAVANMLRQRKPDCEILFIGAEDGMENKLVPLENFRLETLKISNYQRKLTPAAVWHNVTTLLHMSGSMRKVRRIIREFDPDVIVGTGGYASFPALKMGARLGVPTAVHESNAVPGLTTRMVERSVDCIMVSFEDSRRQYTSPERVIVTGTPVREEFLYMDKAEARRQLGLGDKPLVVSYWGSLGAREMNKKIAEFMKCECRDGEPFRHIHATGSYGWRWMPGVCQRAWCGSGRTPRCGNAGVYLRYAAGHGGGGSCDLPRGRGHHQRGCGLRYALHHGPVAERDGQSSGKKRPRAGKARRGDRAARVGMQRRDAL